MNHPVTAPKPPLVEAIPTHALANLKASGVPIDDLELHLNLGLESEDGIEFVFDKREWAMEATRLADVCVELNEHTVPHADESLLIEVEAWPTQCGPDSDYVARIEVDIRNGLVVSSRLCH